MSPPFLQEAKENYDITGLIRPADGEQNRFKINQISFKIKDTCFHLFVGAANLFLLEIENMFSQNLSEPDVFETLIFRGSPDVRF